MGWGLDAHWAALAREHGWRCGVIDAVAISHSAAPAADAYSREEALAEARAFLAERPYLTADETQRTLTPITAILSEGRCRSRVLPEPARPGAGHLGPPSGARRARRRRGGARAGPAPPGSAARLVRARTRGGASALAQLVREPRKQTHDGLRSPTSPLSRRRARLLRALGSMGRAGARAGAAPAAPLVSFDLVHAHNAVPAGDAVRRARPRGVPLVVSVHGGDVLYTAAPRRRRRRGGRARPGRRAPGARQQPRASPSWPAPTAPARRGWCTSAPTCPAAGSSARDAADRRRS